MSTDVGNDERTTTHSDRTLRLVMTAQIWDEIIRQLTTGTHAGAFTLLRQHGTPTSIEFLCDAVQFVDFVPTGEQLRPLDDWLFVTMKQPHQFSPHDIQSFSVSKWQTMFWLKLNAEDPSRWMMSVSRHGRWPTVEEIRMVGRSMLRLLPPQTAADVVATDTLTRWSRTRGVLGHNVMNTLHQCTVTIIGAGRSGSLMAFQLAALGVDTVRLMDADTLDLHNMDATPGVPMVGCGGPKVRALAAGLRLFRPDLTVQLIEERASYRSLTDYLRERSDLVITCTDSDTPRLGVAMVARRNLFVHLDVATSIQWTDDGELQMTGDATLLLPGEGCCSCVGGFADAVATRHDLTAPPNSLRRQMQPDWNEQRAGSLVTLNSMVVGAAVQSWLDLLTGDLRTSIWHRFRWTPGASLSCNASPVTASDDCEICHMFKPFDAPGNGANN